MFAQKTLALLTLTAAFLPATLAAECKFGFKYYQDNEWHYVSHTANIGDTIYVQGHSTKVGRRCVPETTKWHNAEIYSWEEL
ncbi:hypothetical protein LY78DRAFT_595425 [Colletotrichum sublineola]|nr:hypothetical protein LY78DRAFT_595425 [Colletotrichum sublineola]